MVDHARGVREETVGASSLGQAAKRPVSETFEALNDLDSSLIELDRSIEILVERLTPITRQEETLNKSEVLGHPHPNTELASRIHSAVLRVQELTRVVNRQTGLTEL